jgi:branched-chain amino acid transport system ATP-binding protein
MTEVEEAVLMEGSDQQQALCLTGVSKSFGGVHAIRRVTVSVPVGQRRALIGPNGAGKSTLFNLVAGEMTVDEGRIEIFGVDVTKETVRTRARLGMGRTYQISQLFLHLTVEEHLFLGGVVNRGIEFSLFRNWKSYRNDREFAQKIAEDIGLQDHMQTKVKELPHGLQRQLEVGIAMAMRPRLIMLDEPAAGLSPEERRTLTTLIRGLPQNITLMLIEHNMEIVMDIADRITVLHHGVLIAEDTPAGIRANQEVQQVYLGSSHV